MNRRSFLGLLSATTAAISLSRFSSTHEQNTIFHLAESYPKGDVIVKLINIRKYPKLPVNTYVQKSSEGINVVEPWDGHSPKFAVHCVHWFNEYSSKEKYVMTLFHPL